MFVFPRPLFRVTYDETASVPIRDIIERSYLVRRGQNDVLHCARLLLDPRADDVLGCAAF